MKVFYLQEGVRTFLTEGEQDVQVLESFYNAIGKFDPDNVTRKSRKRLKRAWRAMEQALGEQLGKASGIERWQVFGSTK